MGSSAPRCPGDRRRPAHPREGRETVDRRHRQGPQDRTRHASPDGAVHPLVRRRRPAPEPPQYFDDLNALPEKLRKAFLEGDWTSFAGQAFAFSNERHVIAPIAIPESWRRTPNACTPTAPTTTTNTATKSAPRSSPAAAPRTNVANPTVSPDALSRKLWQGRPLPLRHHPWRPASSHRRSPCRWRFRGKSRRWSTPSIGGAAGLRPSR